MFDKLIESDSVQADFKSRTRYFMVSFVVVGTLFLTAVVISLYASDIEIGTSDFDMTRLIAPEIVEVPEPEPAPKAINPQPDNSDPNDLPSRNQAIARADNSTLIPDSVSTERNALREIPLGRYRIGPGPESDGPGAPVGTQSTVGGVLDGTGSAESSRVSTASVPSEPPPPRQARPEPAMKYIGVVNGKAIRLPTPPYPEAARRIGIQGEVTVQIVISESGSVVSSKAVKGHPLLKSAAESSAKGAVFSPTFLGGKPIKATGVIIYRFTRN
jgi:TonB family protein